MYVHYGERQLVCRESHGQEIFDRKECGLFYDSPAYPAASGGECARFRASETEFTRDEPAGDQ
jgi:hypothetical protein